MSKEEVRIWNSRKYTAFSQADPIIGKMSFSLYSERRKSHILQYVKNIHRNTKIGVANDFRKEIK